MNAYLEIDVVNAYHEIRPSAAAWDAVEEKEAAILMASDYLDVNYKFSGVKTLDSQMREFPRNGATALPYKVVSAICELALMSTSLTTGESQKKKSVTVGDISVVYESQTEKIKSYVEKLLRDVVVEESTTTTGTMKQVKLTRA